MTRVERLALIKRAMSMPVVNQYGRPWQELDSLIARSGMTGHYTIFSESGIPLTGVYAANAVSNNYVASGWK